MSQDQLIVEDTDRDPLKSTFDDSACGPMQVHVRVIIACLATLLWFATLSVVDINTVLPSSSSHFTVVTQQGSVASNAPSITTILPAQQLVVQPADFQPVDLSPASRARCPNPESPDFSLVIQCTLDKLWMLNHICRLWPGDIVVAIAMHFESPRLQERIHSSWAGNCDLPIKISHLTTPRRARRLTFIPTIVEARLAQYPVNSMRNLAIAHVTTSHFIYVDIDLWPSANFHQQLEQLAARYPEQIADPQHALVVPSFELRGEGCEPTDSECSLPNTQEEIRKRWGKTVFDFHASTGNNTSQSTTDSRAWLLEDDPMKLRDIQCFLSVKYEPYFLLRKCDFTPKFDERFTGFGKNKIEWVGHLRQAGWRFSVLPVSFLIHNPHPASAGQRAWKKDGHRKQMDKLYDTLISQRQSVYPRPHLGICGQE